MPDTHAVFGLWPIVKSQFWPAKGKSLDAPGLEAG